MADSDPASQPSTGPKLPLDVIYNIGLILSEEPHHAVAEYTNSDYNPDLRPDLRPEYVRDGSPLHKLTYLSKATKDLLEPLLYRNLIFLKPQHITHFFITLVKRPEIRQHVQAIYAFADMAGPLTRKLLLPACKKIWSRRCPSDKPALMRLLDGAGLHKLAWSACMLERTKQRFMFSPDFKHDGILELMFAGILFLVPNVTNFVWRDTNTNPKAFILDHVMSETVDGGIPLMPKLTLLSTEKSAFDYSTQAQFFTPHINLWDNLHTLMLNDIDLDVEFVEMLSRGDFKENRPVKRLHITCVKGAENPVSMSSFPPGFELSSTLLLDPEDLEKDNDKFKAFPNLESLHVCFVFHSERVTVGSLTLKAFIHAVGCPAELVLEGHPLPTMTFDTGVTHSKLKYLKVREFRPNSPARVSSKDSLVAGLNTFWQNKSHLVPNLIAIAWDHYQFSREDLEGEDRAVWELVGEEEWEDDSGDDFEDDLNGSETEYDYDDQMALLGEIQAFVTEANRNGHNLPMPFIADPSE
ncbi:hypothetical protein FGRMN_5336 [Fusarium graminum]|nr:hypothetical protein FGRMN_5336 [Fusarium graminum]